MMHMEIMEEEALPDGYTIEWCHDDDAASPRRHGLGHMYTWMRRYASPDENPYDKPEDFLRAEIKDNFTLDEMIDAVKSGVFESLRFTEGEDGAESLQAYYESTLVPNCAGWEDVEDYNEWGDAEELARVIAECAEAPGFLAGKGTLLTVYCLDHSGVAYSTRPFCDPWDSGAVGFIWVSDREAGRYLSSTTYEPAREDVRAILENEVEEYSAWAAGECYGVFLFKGDELIDSCWGCIGDADLKNGIDDMRSQVPAIA